MSPEALRATYRVQLHKGFTFDDAAAVAPYLARLGVSHLYCSPYLQATAGSKHGYDVTDHARLNDELGGDAGHARMSAALADNGLKQLVDIVPNHMAITGGANRWWWDVLKNGKRSRYAHFFDIDWDPPDESLQGKVLLPFLGDELDAVLARGELRADLSGNEPILRYYDHEFPVASKAPVTHGEVPSTELLEAQHYRLAHWREGDSKLNYRRFFDVKTLAGVRAELPDVFEATHGLILRLIEDDKVHGVRVDHVDGLRDPTRYLVALRRAVGPTPILVEKILEADEELPATWPVEGTTGYEFANLTTALFVDPEAQTALTRTYEDFTGERGDGPSLELECKRLVLEKTLHAEVARLARLLSSIAQRRSVAITSEEATNALLTVVAAFPVYRTYYDAWGSPSRADDPRYVSEALERAADVVEPHILDLLQAVLEGPRGEHERDFMLRFQQTTGPAMAKGFEDTFLYRFNRLTCLNEVGGDPVRFGRSVDGFHAHNQAVQERHPHTLLATSTHDTKRSEDVRARLALLSEIPERWAQQVFHWRALNDKHKTNGLPDAAAEYLLYQTLVGAYPLDPERAVAYMEKASKEAKAHTSWTDPDEAYDGALRDFTASVSSDGEFLASLEEFVTPLLDPGRVNSLAMTLLRLTAPGVPDIYQGTELWDLSLVDPDNRGPVDYTRRREMLERVPGLSARGAWAQRADGTTKLWLVERALRVRREHPEAFGRAAKYAPLQADGERAGHVVAFSRSNAVVVLVPRLSLKVKGAWGDTALELPDGEWTNELTEGSFSGSARVTHLLEAFPVALLTRS